MKQSAAELKILNRNKKDRDKKKKVNISLLPKKAVLRIKNPEKFE